MIDFRIDSVENILEESWITIHQDCPICDIKVIHILCATFLKTLYIFSTLMYKYVHFDEFKISMRRSIFLHWLESQYN